MSASTDLDARDAQGEVAISTCQVAAEVFGGSEKCTMQSCAGGKADSLVITSFCALHTTRVKSASGARRLIIFFCIWFKAFEARMLNQVDTVKQRKIQREWLRQKGKLACGKNSMMGS